MAVDTNNWAKRFVAYVTPAMTPVRLYAMRLPEGAALPAMIYQEISADEQFVSPDRTVPPWVARRIQVDIRGADTTVLEELAEKLRRIIRTMPHDNWIKQTFIQSSRGGQDPDSKLFFKQIDVMLHHIEV